MSRIVMMTSATAALLISSSALAWSWDAGTRLTLVTSNGERIIGVGAVDETRVALTVSSGFAGFAVLVVEATSGALSTFDVVIDADGSILISDDGDFQDLRQSVDDAGLAYHVASEGQGEARSESAAVAEDATAGADVDVEVVGGGAGGFVARGIGRALESVAGAAKGGLMRAREARERASTAASDAMEGEKGVDAAGEGGAGIGGGVDLRLGAGSRVGNGRD
jgi:hypothetical protein